MSIDELKKIAAQSLNVNPEDLQVEECGDVVFFSTKEPPPHCRGIGLIVDTGEKLPVPM